LQTIKALLFEVHPFDPTTLMTAAGAVMIVVITGCWFPARRASQLPPLVALAA
jgi:ABC-type lipoprotein release transport system permease subunit